MLAGVLDVFLPQSCVGCGRAGARCCAGCAAGMAVAPARRGPEPGPPGLPECWSATSYEGAARAAILAYKERGAVGLAGVLAQVLAFTVLTALGAGAGAEAGAEAGTAAGSGAGWARGPFAVVPVPSARRALRVRGHDPMGRVAVLVARHLVASGVRAEPWPALRQARRVADQAGLSSTQRAANLAGSLCVARRAKGPPAPSALLLDDVVTTGASLTEAARALRAAGLRVPMAATVAATRRRS
ncbi:ComF family protein [Nonomuraea sp. NPDC001023]|uniref:ComF family protein n=1 Tax=unclassified Nonomuraea TaxID=2593643 RepID=UPI003318A914